MQVPPPYRVLLTDDQGADDVTFCVSSQTWICTDVGRNATHNRCLAIHEEIRANTSTPGVESLN